MKRSKSVGAIIILFLMVCFVSSCSGKNDYSKIILGDWYYVDYPDEDGVMSFSEDGTCSFGIDEYSYVIDQDSESVELTLVSSDEDYTAIGYFFTEGEDNYLNIDGAIWAKGYDAAIKYSEEHGNTDMDEENTTSDNDDADESTSSYPTDNPYGNWYGYFYTNGHISNAGSIELLADGTAILKYDWSDNYHEYQWRLIDSSRISITDIETGENTVSDLTFHTLDEESKDEFVANVNSGRDFTTEQPDYVSDVDYPEGAQVISFKFRFYDISDFYGVNTDFVNVEFDEKGW